MRWRRRRRPTAPSCGAAAARPRASLSNGRRGPSSGFMAGTSASRASFSKGPFRPSARPSISRRRRGGSRLTYTMEWEPLTLTGRLFGARLARQAGEAIERRILQAVAFVKGERPTILRPAAAHLARRCPRTGRGARSPGRREPLRQRPGRPDRRLRDGRHGVGPGGISSPRRWRGSSAWPSGRRSRPALRR